MEEPVKTSKGLLVRIESCGEKLYDRLSEIPIQDQRVNDEDFVQKVYSVDMEFGKIVIVDRRVVQARLRAQIYSSNGSDIGDIFLSDRFYFLMEDIDKNREKSAGDDTLKYNEWLNQ